MSRNARTNALEWCRERLAGPSEDLYLAVLFAPPAHRQCVRAVAALYLELEAVTRNHRDLNIARTKLAWWREELLRLDAGRPAHPATRLLADAGARHAALAIGDLVGGFELILLQGPITDLATAELTAQRGCARLARALTILDDGTGATAPVALQAGEAVGFARALSDGALAASARAAVAEAARGRLAELGGQLQTLPQPLRVLSALAWRRIERSGKDATPPGGRRARVFAAWRAARGHWPRSLRRAWRHSSPDPA